MNANVKNLPNGITASEVIETTYKNFKTNRQGTKFILDKQGNLIVESTYIVKTINLFSNEIGFDGLKNSVCVAYINLNENTLHSHHGYFAPHKTGVKINNWFNKYKKLI